MGESMNVPTDNFIGGAWRSGGGAAFSSTDPASGASVWEGASASAADVADAVAAARAAFPAWAATPLSERRDLMLAFKAQLEANKDELARLIARETGKPLWETLGEAGAMAGKIDISLKAYADRTGDTVNDTAFGQARLAHRPHGVMAVFGPYNFPGHLPNGHIVPALIAGDVVVFKPSEITPAVGAAMVALWEKAGLPAGVINLVQGAREAGGALLDQDINGVLFTGSVDTGVMFHRKFAGRPDVMLALEMGGNNPLVIWDASDADAAANIALNSAFITTGQRCTCARRLIVADGAAGDAVVDKLVDLTNRIRIAAWDADPEPFMGPLVSEKAADGVLAAQDALVAKGASVIRRAERLEVGPAFISPGMLDMRGASDVGDTEVFGPLLQVWRAASFEEALERANATKFGLSAGLVSDSADLWAAFHAGARAGIINWNRPTTGAASNMPFGGPGFSGNHRPSAYYAADYCAYPVASQESATLSAIATKGLDTEGS